MRSQPVRIDSPRLHCSGGSVKEKKTLYSWMQAGRRDTSNMERIFNDLVRLPYEQRLEVMNRLAGQVFKEDADQ